MELWKCVSALTHHHKKRSFKPTEGNIYAQALQCWLSQDNPETLACARVVCHTEHTHTGIVNTCSFSDHARVRARAIPAHIVDAWRERIFADALAELGLVRVATMGMKLKAKSSQAA